MILEPRLRRDPARAARPQRCCDRVKCLRERLARFLVFEEEGVRVEIVALIELAAEPSDVSDLDQHLPRQLALNRKVDSVIARIEQLRIVEERQQLAEWLIGNDRRLDGRVDRHRNVAVDSRAEGLTRLIRWAQNRQRLSEPDAEHRHDYGCNRVGAVVGQRVAASNDGLAIAESLAKPSFLE